MNDQTQIIPKPNPDSGESFFLSRNLSGRFWIALTLALGWVLCTVLVLGGAVSLDSNLAIAVYTAYSSGAGGVVGFYMGQNAKNQPKDTEKPA